METNLKLGQIFQKPKLDQLVYVTRQLLRGLFIQHHNLIIDAQSGQFSSNFVEYLQFKLLRHGVNNAV